MPAANVASLRPVDRACPVPVSGVRSEQPAWYHPQGEGDAAHLERWCSTVGAPVLVANPTPGSFDGDVTDPGAGTTDDLIVATWNPNAGAGDLLRFVEAELGHSCGTGRGPPFVLMLQEALRRSHDIPRPTASAVVPPAVAEAARGSERLDVVEVAEQCGLSILYAAAARNGADERDGLPEEKGNAIISSLPISDPIVVELPFEGARRVTTIGTVRLPAGWSVRVASVHFLSSARPWRVLTTGNASRLREATGLLEALESIEGEHGALPTIAAGDLNTWSRRETALFRLRDYFVDSPAPLAEPTRGSFPTDHILFREQSGHAASLAPGSYRRIDEAYNSDHHPVVAVVSDDSQR
jgi:endonuclease/exonuclease/phosphatase family metal-dependent hydrolase